MGRSASPGRTAARWLCAETFSHRQLSTIERIAATLGPVCGLPTTWI